MKFLRSEQTDVCCNASQKTTKIVSFNWFARTFNFLPDLWLHDWPWWQQKYSSHALTCCLLPVRPRDITNYTNYESSRRHRRHTPLETLRSFVKVEVAVLKVPNSPFGLCGRKTTLEEEYSPPQFKSERLKNIFQFLLQRPYNYMVSVT